MWSKWAIQRGWSVEEVAAQLMELSTKAQEKKHGKPYALKTAQQAAVAAERDEVGQGRGRKGKAAEPLSSDGGGAG
jgi:hypothetical protein